MAMVDTYEIARKHTELSANLIPMLKNAIDRLLVYKDEKTNMFY